MRLSAARKWRLGVAAIAVVASVGAAMVGPFAERADAALPAPLLLPFPIGQTWFVCQGYNGTVSGTHNGIPALDLSVSPTSQGPDGCTPATANASTGRSVTAPAAGTANRINSDLVCLNFDVGGGSSLIGHVNSGSRPTSGTRVAAGAALGTVAPPGTGGNGGYAHIHIQAYSQPGCGNAPKISFADVNQARFQCAPDLPFDTDAARTNQHGGLNGKYLSRCGTRTATGVKLNLELTVPGVSLLGADNRNPLHPRRTLTVDLYNTSGQFVTSRSVTATFSSASGAFTAVVDLGANWAAGLYEIRARLPREVGYTLRKSLLGTSFGTFYNFGPQTNVVLPRTPLVTGDVNQDNRLDILDYNLILDCMGTKPCQPVHKAGADLDDNGTVDGVDYNIWLRNFSDGPRST